MAVRAAEEGGPLKAVLRIKAVIVLDKIRGYHNIQDPGLITDSAYP